MIRWQIWLTGAALIGATAVGASVLTSRGELARGRGADSALPAGPGDTTGIEPDAVAALDKMGKYLRTLKSMQVKAVVTTEEVSLDGQKVQSSSVVDLLAERPNHMRAEVANDRQPRVFYYDGSKFTLYAPRLKFYAQVDAPSTLGELADQLEDKFGITLPLVDLFRWGTPESGLKDLTGAVDVGPASIDGTTCEQYLFRQDGLDWQIWIQRGEYPLPRKLVLTTTTDEARPQHTSVWTWNLTPSYNAQEFAFVAPEGAKKISFIDVAKVRTVAAAKGGTTNKTAKASKANKGSKK